MTISYHARKRLGVTASGAVLTVVAVLMLVPMAWMAFTSFKLDADIFTTTPLRIPEAFTLEHYDNLFTRFHFGSSFLNSTLIAVATVVLSVGIGGLAAYGFARYPWRGSGVALAFLMVARMVTPAALVVPLYVIMQSVGLLNSVSGVIVGVTVLNLPFVVWILKPFFETVPKEVEEAAELDGLSPFAVFFRIVIPLALPGIMTAVLYSFLAGWTDLLFPMTFITDTEIMPLTSSLLQMQTGYKIYWGELMAGGIVLTLPAVVLCFALQRYLLRGLRSGF
ncbi:ABC transporter, permease protein [Microbacterium esteraromaticum]|uniref:ABC transporter, permease protein n=1 Tax=Microbacterium esteraromaticum TaxID=57043 RepID=A0A1R4KHX7_9MICO|nr:carbohydrate ABC transporter permease [Microbacterium esteraromaticum]SJN43797.1 ABC transporter, permease protein [Microbacterium esteraromaticum]